MTWSVWIFPPEAVVQAGLDLLNSHPLTHPSIPPIPPSPHPLHPSIPPSLYPPIPPSPPPTHPPSPSLPCTPPSSPAAIAPDQDGVADYLENLRHHLARRNISTEIITTHDSAQAMADPTVNGALTEWTLPQLLPLVQKILATPTDILHIQHAAGSYKFERPVFSAAAAAADGGLPACHCHHGPRVRLVGVGARLVPVFLAGKPEASGGKKRVWWDREDGFFAHRQRRHHYHQREHHRHYAGAAAVPAPADCTPSPLPPT